MNKNKNKFGIKLFLITVLIIIGVLSAKYIVKANYDISMEEVNNFPMETLGTPVQEKIIKPYVFTSSTYTPIGQFPINRDVFNSSKDYFCVQHGVAYGSNERNRVLGSDYHKEYSGIVGHKNHEAHINDPKGDIDDTCLIFTDENGNYDDSKFDDEVEYIGYKDLGETPSDRLYTNWVYNVSDLKFDCEGASSGLAANPKISDAAMAFLLACYKQGGPNNDTVRGSYVNDPLQHAVWDWRGQLGEKENPYFAAGKAFEKYHDASAKPNVDVYPAKDIGTVKTDTGYKVGPFKMSKYVRAKDYSYNEEGIINDEYLGESEDINEDEKEDININLHKTNVNLQDVFFSMNKEYKGSIIKAEAVLSSGKKVSFPIPEPEAEFYINLTDSDLAGSDEIVDIIFTYQRIHVSANGKLYTGLQYCVPFSEKKSEQSSCSYSCQEGPTGCSECGTYISPGTTSEPYTGPCTHSYYTGCWNTTESEEVEHEVTDADGNTHTETTTHYYTVHHQGTHHSVTHEHTYYCDHGHKDCWKIWWQRGAPYDCAQDAIAASAVLVPEQKTYTIKVNIPIKTRLEIYKYIVDVSHVGELGNIYSGTDRRDKTMAEKANDPVIVERGDLVTYKIELLNYSSKFDTIVKVKDIFPPSDVCEVCEIPDEIKYSKEIVVKHAENGKPTKNEYTIKVIPTTDSGDYKNVIKFITTNSGSQHMKYVSWGKDSATHGEHTRGNIVNTNSQGNVDNLKEIDSDNYRIKEYNVDIKKYIYDVNHKGTADSSLDTSLAATKERYSMTEETKKSNPVYAEYGDQVEYKIVVYNTTSEYNSNIDNSASPYYSPDKVYVNIKDVLPNKYVLDEVTANYNADDGGDIYSYQDNNGTLYIKDLMVPANGVRIVTVKLTIEEVEKGVVEENTASLVDGIRNINRSPDVQRKDDKYCVIKNNNESGGLTSNDYYKLNNYNIFMDKYINNYDEAIAIEDNDNRFTQNNFVTEGQDHKLIVSRRNASAKYDDSSDNNVNDKIKDPGKQEQYKKDHPLSVEHGEKITYYIRALNDSQYINKNDYKSEDKVATQVRTSKIKDLMQIGLKLDKVSGYKVEANNSYIPVDVQVRSNGIVTKDNNKYNEYIYVIGDETILDPGQEMIYVVEVSIEETNMYLGSLENTASIVELTNINETDTHRDVTKQNISRQQETKDFVRMKDLVISGHVWLDYDRDGYMNDTISNHDKVFYGLNDSGGKRDVTVKLYRIEPGQNTGGTLVRTTKTDNDGLYTFARNDKLEYYDSFNYDSNYEDKTYQRVDKANNKDANGNYSKDSKYYNYYVEYEYDGITYACTDHYACSYPLNVPDAIDNGTIHINSDGSIQEKYKIDSNAYEFRDVRHKFDASHEYISYNSAYEKDKVANKLNKTEDLVFDKNNHKSELVEDPSRIVTARSFIKKSSPTSTPENNTYLWLYEPDDYENVSNEEDRAKLPSTEYTKYINCGLYYRGDVDFSLSKDVYDVTTLIDGEKMEYGFNKNNTINGIADKAENKSEYVKDFMVNKPYGLELYESDYKQRVDQYTSDMVKMYKGINGESELNVAVTYRIQLDNHVVSDDDTVKNREIHNERLKVKIAEILDLYDKNFMEAKFNEDGTYDKENNIVPIKLKDENGNLYTPEKPSDAKNLDERMQRVEAWYYRKIEDNEVVNPNDRYSIVKQDKGEKPNYVQDPKGEYVKVDLVVRNKSYRGEEGPFSERTIDASKDGYNTLYLSPKDDKEIIINEGDSFDVYVKYIVDKDTLTMAIDEESGKAYEETNSTTETTENKDKTIKVINNSTTTNKSYEATIKRSLKIAEAVANKINPRGLENIAQINAYAVYYERNGLPVGIVDMNSNVGNIGIKNDFEIDSEEENRFTQPGDPNYKEVETSYDDVDYYEDTTYKTGIEIIANGTVNTKEDLEKCYKGEIILVKDKKKIERKVNGIVWDDSRTEAIEEQQGMMFHGNGRYRPEAQVYYSTEEYDKVSKNCDGDYDEIKEKNGNKPLVNALIENKYGLTENKDIPVRNAKAEFIEIVKVPANNADRPEDQYYEQVLTDVSWPQVQNTRTKENGTYELKGLIPGKYIVRFTYGDTIKELASSEVNDADPQEKMQQDMLIYNGQDYKSTIYQTPKEEENINHEDAVINSLENKGFNDARDDEIRRLSVNSYSEVMTNEKAEILKGLANGTNLAKISEANDPKDLKKLTDNTYMNAETQEFLIKPEKLTDEQYKPYDKKVEEGLYYNDLDNIKYEINQNRDFQIKNIDFGLEYRPESRINLLKEINEVKLITQDGNTLVDLIFDSKIDDKGNLIRTINSEESKGLELVQFISNDYNKKMYNALEEKVQGFVYLQVDDEILHGAKVEVKYKFKAQNNSEIDKISENLNLIRYKENPKTQEMIAKYTDKILEGNYTASGTAKNMLKSDFYKVDKYQDVYRNNIKSPYTVSGNNELGYFGKYLGDTYYTGENVNNKDVVASLKFDAILDYVDTNLEYEKQTESKELVNKYWNKVEPIELLPYLSIYKGLRVGAAIPGTTVVSSVDPIINSDNEKYNNLVVSVDDSRYDNQPKEEYYNNDLSRYLLPRQLDESNEHAYTGVIELPVSKVLAQENETKDMSYENLAEIVKFTTQTGRRTNFETTIGNADVTISEDDEKNLPLDEHVNGSKEFKIASLELDTAATETITLTPPTGLMRNRQTIVNTVETASVGIRYVIIIAAVVLITLFVIKVIKNKIKNKRYK